MFLEYFSLCFLLYLWLQKLFLKHLTPARRQKWVAVETGFEALLALFSAFQAYVEGRVLPHTLPSCRYQFITETSYTDRNSEEVTMCNVEQIVLDHYHANGFPQGMCAKTANILLAHSFSNMGIMCMPTSLALQNVESHFHSWFSPDCSKDVQK